jgi:solute:Na+ symporter, SSS family
VMIMASVTLAAIKIGGVLLGLDPVATVVVAGSITVVYSLLGGLTGVLVTDFLQFSVAMAGSVAAAVYALARPEVGGLGSLLARPEIHARLGLVPDFSDRSLAFTIFVIPLAVQWWSVWYPGAEPGGGGYVAQRMLAAKSEGHAQGATLLFNVAHYALRPWPWILVALASLVVFPDLATLRAAFPHVDPGVIGNDLAYPAMLTFLPPGLLGLVVASLIAAYMSTISTHLNWGASYVVNDFYRRFVAPDASEARLVRVGRIATAALMVLAGALSLLLSHALQAFQILLQIGAGTGLLFILRWFWWRVNAASEIAAMTVSFVIAAYFQLFHGRLFGRLPSDTEQLLTGVGVTTLAWVAVTYLTRPTAEQTLRAFYRKIGPRGPGWEPVLRRAEAEGIRLRAEARGASLPQAFLCMGLGCVAVYAALFATGLFLYGRQAPAAALAALAVVASVVIVRVWSRWEAA